MTVPSGTTSTQLVVLAVNTITSTPISMTASGMTQCFSAQEGTSAMGFVFTGTGFTAGQTITVTLSVSNRASAVGAVYSNAQFEQVGSGGATSTTGANAPSITTQVANDVAVGVAFGVGTAARTFSSLTAGWTNRTSTNGGSGTRFATLEIADLTVASPSATGTLTATASGTLLSSTGVQLALQSNGSITVTVTNPGNQTGTVGTPVTLPISASDSGGLTLSYGATGLPGGLSINSSSGTISGTPNASGTFNVTVTATDTSSNSGSASFTWTINTSVSGTVRKVDVSGTATTVSGRQVNVGGTSTTATRRVNVNGVAT